MAQRRRDRSGPPARALDARRRPDDAAALHVDVVRATNDVDIVLHIETTRGVAAAAASALESLGYELASPTDPRVEIAHRFRRGTATVDLLSSTPDQVDVLIADHPAPRVVEKLRGRTMVAIEGGTQALRRTVNARLPITPDRITTVSIPSTFGALVLKAAAYQTDTRDRDRHLSDAAALLCCLEDPYADRESFTGSDRRRVELLRKALPDSHPAWRVLGGDVRGQGQAALRLLTAG
ncbi:class II aldolase/adducin family protein [Dactylosporangium maewongense]|uniref:class II aldolase/adducin family protein n=1 Tax=Dactylosporangium maewongense TaxID=634393 RepID=UPI0031E32E54